MATGVRTQMLGRSVSFSVSEPWLAYWLVITRLAVGWWMLHAGLDKFLGWPFDAGWFVGGAAQQTSLAPLVAPLADGALLAFVNVAIPVGQTLIVLGLLIWMCYAIYKVAATTPKEEDPAKSEAAA